MTEHALPSRKVFTPTTVARACGGIELYLHVEPGDEILLAIGRRAGFEVLDDPFGVRAVGPMARDFRSIRNGHRREPSMPLELETLYLANPPATLWVPVGRLDGGRTDVLHLQATVFAPDGSATLTNPVILSLVASVDCDGNGISDDCDIFESPGLDMNGDGELDACEDRVRLYVDSKAPPGGDGLSWATAYDGLQQALGASFEDPAVGEIFVAAGTYVPGTSRTDSFHLPPGVAIYGGFAGFEDQVAQRDIASNPTVLSGDIFGDDHGTLGRENNSYQVIQVEGEGGHRLDGFVVTAGYSSGGNCYPGAAIDASQASELTVANCLFTNHDCCSSAPLRAVGTDLTLINSRFVGNHGASAGAVSVGAVLVEPEFVTIANCEFIGNSGGGAGAVYVGGSQAQGSVRIINCTVYGNSSTNAANPGGIKVVLQGMSLFGRGETAIHNTIFAENTSAGVLGSNTQLQLTGSGGPPYSASEFELTYSALAPAPSPDIPGHDNIFVSPVFLDALGPDGIAGTLDDDLRLAPGSPCIDAGRNGILPFDVIDLDLDGNTVERLPGDLLGVPRRLDDPNVADTGAGSPPLVDMGAHEHSP